jgi:hypothetical protein
VLALCSTLSAVDNPARQALVPGPAAVALRGVLVDQYSERHVLLAAQLGLGLVSAALE